jgi:hypothetical protein
MSIQSAQFINETNFPIEVSGLIQFMSGLNKLESKIVMPSEQCTIISITGEWFLNIPPEYSDMWEKIETGYSIGKFRNSPCIRGNYSWMDTDNFTIVFNNNVFKFIMEIFQ